MRTTQRSASRIAAAVSVVLLCCSIVAAQEVQYNYDRSADFTKYKTYKWVLIEGGKHPDQLTDQNIVQVLDAQLAEKGLTKKTSDPVDLYIGYQVSVEQEKELTGYGGGPGWRFGGGMAMATTSSISNGTLVLDIYDPAMKQMLWRGSATETLEPSSNPDKQMKRLQKAMAKLLASYPPGAAKK